MHTCHRLTYSKTKISCKQYSSLTAIAFCFRLMYRYLTTLQKYVFVLITKWLLNFRCLGMQVGVRPQSGDLLLILRYLTLCIQIILTSSIWYVESHVDERFTICMTCQILCNTLRPNSYLHTQTSGIQGTIK